MEKVKLKDVKLEQLKCFRGAIRTDQDFVRLYPNLKWDNPKLKEVTKDILTDTSFEYDKSKQK